MSDQLHLLKTERFLPLFITQFFGAFNDNAFKNAFLIWFTYDVASEHALDAPTIVTLAAGLFILPFFLFSATAGQIADKYERSWLAQKIKQIEIILMLICALFFHLQSVNGLLAVLFLMGLQSTFFGPIKYSLLPDHLRNDELISGNGFIEGGTFLSILLGTIFGGLIIRTEYGVELLSFFMVSFAVIGWLSSRQIPKAPIGDSKLRIGWNIICETWRIIGFAREERAVWLSIIGISWFWLIGAIFLTQFPIYTKEVIGGNEHIVTLFLTIFSIGIGIGSMWCNKLLKGKIDGKLVPYGSIGMTLAIVIFSASSYYYDNSFEVIDLIGLPEFFGNGFSSWVIIIGLLMLSICAGIYIVPLYAIMQHRSEDKYLARVIAANNMMNALFMVISSIVVILLYSISFDVKEILLAVGIFNIPVFFIVSRKISSITWNSKN